MSITTRGLSLTKTLAEAGSTPVSLEEVKEYLVIDGNDHDTLLARLIEAATVAVEKYCGISLRETAITCRYEAAGRVEIPYGPVQSITSVEDADGSAVEYTQEGLAGSFIALDLQRTVPTVITYVAGYTEVDEALKLAITKKVVDDFEMRSGVNLSDQTRQLLPNNWQSAAKPYRRITWWA